MPLIAQEKEHPVAADRAAKGCSKLVLAQRGNRLARIVEGVPGNELVIPQKLNCASVKKVAAGLRDHIDKSRRLASEFFGLQRLLYFELLNNIDGWNDPEIG